MAKYNSIDHYISTQKERQAELLQQLRNAILEAAPHAEETFNYGVPAFNLIENAKMEQQIMIAGFKNHIAIYPHPTTIDKFEKELSAYKQGKGSIQFQLDAPIPKELIVDMVKYRMRLVKK